MMSEMLSRQDWLNLAAELAMPNQAFINGKWQAAESGRTLTCVNPATGNPIAEVADCDRDDVDRAVTGARDAFRTGSWSCLQPRDRKQVLLKLADLVCANARDLALMETLSMGKPIRDSYGSDIPGAASFIAWFAETADKLYGEVAPAATGSMAFVTREPLGVIGAIVPWNYPLEEAVVKLAPALAAGNSVVLKPSELTPFSALRLAELAVEAGLPAGVLNVLPGRGETAGRALGCHPRVNAISFTGSTEVGRLLMGNAAGSGIRPVWLECGGKSPNIVFADCRRLEVAADETVRGIFRNQGQVCSATSRLLVERNIHQDFLAMVVDRAQQIVPGDPLDPMTRLGAVASRQHCNRVMNYIEIGKDEGAILALGGLEMQIDGRGCYLVPTIFDEVCPEMRIAQEEIFGPVLCVTPFEDESDAIRIANDSQYGLVASVWTDDLSRAHRMARRLEAGTVTVNGVDAQSEAVPFGGYKQSGIGRERSLHAFNQYTNLKTTWFCLD